MTAERIAQSSAPSTRHLRCDPDFLDLLEQDFGIPAYSLNMAFMGVPPESKTLAIALCEWVTRKASAPDEAGDLLRRWARKHKRGQYHPAM